METIFVLLGISEIFFGLFVGASINHEFNNGLIAIIVISVYILKGIIFFWMGSILAKLRENVSYNKKIYYELLNIRKSLSKENDSKENDSKEINILEMQIRNGLYYEVNQEKPYTGKAIQYYENGQIERKAQYKDGKLEGEHITYYENGKIERKAQYKDGKRNGEVIRYYENEQVKEKLQYKDGKLIK